MSRMVEWKSTEPPDEFVLKYSYKLCELVTDSGPVDLYYHPGSASIFSRRASGWSICDVSPETLLFSINPEQYEDFGPTGEDRATEGHSDPT